MAREVLCRRPGGPATAVLACSAARPHLTFLPAITVSALAVPEFAVMGAFGFSFLGFLASLLPRFFPWTWRCSFGGSSGRPVPVGWIAQEAERLRSAPHAVQVVSGEGLASVGFASGIRYRQCRDGRGGGGRRLRVSVREDRKGKVRWTVSRSNARPRRAGRGARGNAPAGGRQHFRLNMPFEPGINYRCRQYCGNGREERAS